MTGTNSLYYKYWYIRNKEETLKKCKAYYEEKGKESRRRNYVLKKEYSRLANIDLHAEGG